MPRRKNDEWDYRKRPGQRVLREVPRPVPKRLLREIFARYLELRKRYGKPS